MIKTKETKPGKNFSYIEQGLKTWKPLLNDPSTLVVFLLLILFVQADL
jgi:hypothetical protein